MNANIKRLPTDTGASFRSGAFRSARVKLGIRHRFTRAYRPYTRGKPEHFIQ